MFLRGCRTRFSVQQILGFRRLAVDRDCVKVISFYTDALNKRTARFGGPFFCICVVA